MALTNSSTKRKINEPPDSQKKQTKITSFFTEPRPTSKLKSDGNQDKRSQLELNEQESAFPSSSASAQSQISEIEITHVPEAESSKVATDKKPTDISKSKDESPVQIKLKKYPQSKIGVEMRSFSSTWFSKYPFLEYSQITDRAYCFVCRHFATSEASSLKTGHYNWKNINFALSKHFVSQDHIFNQEKYITYQKSKSNSISNQINVHHKSDVIRNRSVVALHSEVILFCAQQGISLRGHREKSCDENSEQINTGNFLSLVALLAKKSPELGKNESKMPQNAKYTSPDFQNEIISIAARLVCQKISGEINESGGNFAVIADETRDAGGTEQLSVCVRYVYNSKIRKRFLGFTGLSKFDAESICIAIIEMVESSGLSIKNCTSQSYDGAAVMSGDVTGVHIRLEKEVGGYCPYIHCYAHKLNLVLVDSCKSIKEVLEFLGLLQSIYNFQSNSSRRGLYFEESQKIKGYSLILKIPQSCDTRWSSKMKGISYFKSRLDSVILAFKNIVKTGKPEEIAESRGYLNQLCSFKNVIVLIIMEKVLSLTNSLSEYLQDSQLSLPRANSLCVATIKSLEKIRSESSFLEVWNESEALAKKCSIKIPDAQQHKSSRQRSLSVKLKNSIVMSTVGGKSDLETQEGITTEFRRVFYEVIDKFVAEMMRRIAVNDELSLGISAADPSSPNFLNIEYILKFFKLYSGFKVNEAGLRSQVSVAKNLFESEKCESPVDCYNFLLTMKLSFPDLLLYFYLVILIPVSSCTSERSFSSLKRIKTRLRTTMLDSRTSDLAVLCIERDVSNIFYQNSDVIVDEFARVGNRKLELSL